MSLTPNQAHYVLNSLIAQGKLRLSQIQKTLKGRETEIRALKERLASLEGVGASSAARTGRRSRRSRSADGGARRRRKMSPRVRALRRLQGKYMGYVRRLKPAEKARVRAVREKQGIGPAIRLASSLAAKS
jgi:hypothetical protein